MTMTMTSRCANSFWSRHVVFVIEFLKEEVMTDRKNYASLVESVFGEGSATFDVSETQTNNVIRALASSGDYVEFRANFEYRLRRLAAAIQSDKTLRREILVALNKLVTSGCDGAYAELCALDYFLADKTTGPGQIVLDRTVPAIQTLASEMGMQDANHDLNFPGLGVSMDTKLLSDKIGGILEGVFKDFRSAKKIRHLTILPSYDRDEDFSLYQSNRKKLLNELNQGVDIINKKTSLSSQVIPGLSYEFAWTAGVLLAANSYSPVEHAKNHHRLLFTHAKKFSRVEPTVIVFVLFPWTDEGVFHFEDSKNVFFKQFGDQFFSGYLGSTQPAKLFNSKITSTILAGDVTKHLSGVLYLEDASITAKTPNDVNVKASYLWNRNAVHPLAGSLLEATLKARGAFDLR